MKLKLVLLDSVEWDDLFERDAEKRKMGCRIHLRHQSRLPRTGKAIVARIENTRK